MPKKNVIWSPAAEKDMETIMDYIEISWPLWILKRFINKVDDCVNLITENEKLFPLINSELNIRKCVITKHNTLFYSEWDDKLEIVRLFDSRQDPNKLTY